MLFDPLKIRGLEIRNRVWLPPMCQYQVEGADGRATDWHLVHYGARAAGGFGLIVVEATAVAPAGRITVGDLGLWQDDQVAGLARLVDFSHRQGAAMAVQLAHAGRKGSTWRDLPHFPKGSQPLDQGGYATWGPTAEAFPGLAAPAAMGPEQVAAIPDQFAEAARRADRAGFDVIELHAAHGYLLHQFLSPLSNQRTDQWGGGFEGRTRLTRQVVEAVRRVWPEDKPLFVRLSATEWTEDGWSLDDTCALVDQLGGLGVDLIDVSSGGNIITRIPSAPGYQVALAAEVKRVTGLPTAAVGLITEPAQAEQIVQSGQADAVLIGRAGLREPAWPERAADFLGVDTPLAPSYHRGAWRRSG
ncbi:MAG: NADH:flavin oxidoreductase/NADH oxidase [Propionibacteriaceae bacterium]|jgi:2,4-dienoyl-CoA reductase-like NADH-dependent reductase (Old Yellow Enzyme family)|nr:NADH:flavin oxidoreductase/NADH oxidase [Propionibacteriaceae bacterium]